MHVGVGAQVLSLGVVFVRRGGCVGTRSSMSRYTEVSDTSLRESGGGRLGVLGGARRRRSWYMGGSKVELEKC